MSQVLISALSLAGVGALVGLALLLGFSASAKLQSSDDLARLLRELEPQASLSDAVVDDRGRAGIGLLGDGRIIVARAMGAQFATRLLPRQGVRSVRKRSNVDGKAGVTIAFDDVGFPPLKLRLPGREPPTWLEQLGRVAGRGK